MPWVTPPDPPGDNVCIKVYCPLGVDYEATLKGAIFELTLVENWENVDGQTAEDVAQAFYDAYQETLLWRRCMPIGTVFFSARTTAPDGSLLCDGSSYATADYPDLFDAIGYVWGGSGSTFNVPDMRRRCAYGSGSGFSVGDNGGAESHTLVESEMPSHVHSVPVSASTGGGVEPFPNTIPNILLPISTGSAGGDQAHNNLPPYRALLPCISY